MKFGILLSDVPTSTPPRQQLHDMFRIVHAAQESGIRYIAIGQHFLYGDLRWLQPVPLLARLAAEVGPDIRLVTQIMIAPLYHPVLLAEEIATLDVVTEGRLVFGAGLGYRPEEFGYLDVPFAERAARMDETIEMLIQLWTEPEVTHKGRFFELDHVVPHIQPLQTPYPPLWVGGHSAPGARRAGRYGDFYPVPPEATEEQMTERFGIIREEFAKRNKPFGPQPVRRNISSPRTATLHSRSSFGWPKAVTSPMPSVDWTSTPRTSWNGTSLKRRRPTPSWARPMRWWARCVAWPSGCPSTPSSSSPSGPP